MEPFADRYAELRDSIAFKAGATTSEAEAYLNLGRIPITRETELRFQNSLARFSLEERRFIHDNHIIASSLKNLQVPLAPVIPVKQKRAPAKRKPTKDSTELNKLIVKLAKKNLSIQDIIDAAKEAFPKLKEDITPDVIRSRKSRLRKRGKLP